LLQAILIIIVKIEVQKGVSKLTVFFVSIIAGVMALVATIISLFPNVEVQSVVNLGNSLLKYGLAFVPASCWGTFLTTIIAFNTYKFSWAIIEWCYKKIPGIS